MVYIYIYIYIYTLYRFVTRSHQILGCSVCRDTPIHDPIPTLQALDRANLDVKRHSEHAAGPAGLSESLGLFAPRFVRSIHQWCSALRVYN